MEEDRFGAGKPLRFGRIMHIEEILRNKDKLDEESVRVLGKVVEFDIQQNTAKLEAGGNILTLNTTLLNQIPFKRSSLYQCIGELECVGEEIVLKVRVVRNADGLDVKLYDEALTLRRQFLQESTFLPSMMST